MILNQPLLTVTPTLDGDVLAVLAAASEARFTTGQLHRVLGRYSEHGIRKVLRRLVKQGVVLVEQVGNVSSYSLNDEHLAAQPIKWLSDSRSRLVGRLSELIVTWELQPRFAALFGSAVRGAMRIDSDIDIIVITRDGESGSIWDTQWLDLHLSIPRWTGNRAGLVTMTESELAARGSDELLSDVRTYGLTIGGDRIWFEHAIRFAVGRG